PLNRRTAILFAAVDIEREQLFGNGVEVVGERHHEAHPVFTGGGRTLAVFIHGDLQIGLLAVALRGGEFVDDLPQLRARLIDQALHRTAGVEQNRHFDVWAIVLLFGGDFGFRLLFRGHSGRVFRRGLLFLRVDL